MKWLLFLLLVLCSCGRDSTRLVAYEPGMDDMVTAMEAWNHLCGITLFQTGKGDVRAMWVDSLGQDRLAVSAAAILVARDQWITRNHADHIAILGHELWHVLASGYDGVDAYGHTADGGWSRAVGGLDWPDAADKSYLIELGYPCQ